MTTLIAFMYQHYKVYFCFSLSFLVILVLKHISKTTKHLFISVFMKVFNPFAVHQAKPPKVQNDDDGYSRREPRKG